MSDQAIVALVGAAGAAVASMVAWLTGRRKGAADAAEGAARAEVTLSGEARAIAAELRADLAAEKVERHRLEGELDIERRKCAEIERRLGDAERTILELVREVRRLGGHVPGDTPAGGTPTTGGAT